MAGAEGVQGEYCSLDLDGCLAECEPLPALATDKCGCGEEGICESGSGCSETGECLVFQAGRRPTKPQFMVVLLKSE